MILSFVVILGWIGVWPLEYAQRAASTLRLRQICALGPPRFNYCHDRSDTSHTLWHAHLIAQSSLKQADAWLQVDAWCTLWVETVC